MRRICGNRRSQCRSRRPCGEVEVTGGGRGDWGERGPFLGVLGVLRPEVPLTGVPCSSAPAAWSPAWSLCCKQTTLSALCALLPHSLDAHFLALTLVVTIGSALWWPWDCPLVFAVSGDKLVSVCPTVFVFQSQWVLCNLVFCFFKHRPEGLLGRKCGSGMVEPCWACARLGDQSPAPPSPA